MINLSLLENLIQNANSLSPSESAVDEHFDQIVNFVEQEKNKDLTLVSCKILYKDDCC